MVANLVYISILLDIISGDIFQRGGYIMFYREYSDSIIVDIEDIGSKKSGGVIRDIIMFLEKEARPAYIRVYDEYRDVRLGIHVDSIDSKEYLYYVSDPVTDWERVLVKKFLKVTENGDS